MFKHFRPIQNFKLRRLLSAYDLMHQHLRKQQRVLDQEVIYHYTCYEQGHKHPQDKKPNETPSSLTIHQSWKITDIVRVLNVQRPSDTSSKHQLSLQNHTSKLYIKKQNLHNTSLHSPIQQTHPTKENKTATSSIPPFHK